MAVRGRTSLAQYWSNNSTPNFKINFNEDISLVDINCDDCSTFVNFSAAIFVTTSQRNNLLTINFEGKSATFQKLKVTIRSWDYDEIINPGWQANIIVKLSFKYLVRGASTEYGSHKATFHSRSVLNFSLWSRYSNYERNFGILYVNSTYRNPMLQYPWLTPVVAHKI